MMANPLVAADINTYERSVIKGWLRGNDFSPVTGVVMYHMTVVTNYLLRSTFQDRRGGHDAYEYRRR